MINFFKIFLILLVSISFFQINKDDLINAQDIPELHMVIFQGDVMLTGSFAKTSSLDGFLLEAKVDGKTLGTTVIGKDLTGRFSGLELGPDIIAEGGIISFWIGNQKAIETDIFGPVTTTGEYCRGCTWSLPLSRSINLHFESVPLPTPTPAPAPVEPSFLTGTLIFGSILSAPEGVNVIEAYIEDELIGTGTVNGPDFSITLDPGNETYLGKTVMFQIAGYESKTKYTFVAEDFQTDFKLFFPQYIPPTPVPAATAVPTAIPTPEPTRTSTPVPEPTPTYTPTATPTPIVVSTSSDLILDNSDGSDGGCNSRGGGPASVGLLLLSLAPVYIISRRRKK
ncbi:MAG: hypothetical protein CL438_08785 [Acidimicrobiaceae bacterium]|nr:hypothetical protein [Acidimicrobiaceae bacterium]